MASDTRQPETHVLFIGESTLVYCMDFSDEPVVAAGETLSTPTVTVVDVAKVTLGAPQVLTDVFYEYAANGLVGDSVPSGKGIKFPVTPIAKGECTVLVNAVASGGSTPGKTVKFLVK